VVARKLWEMRFLASEIDRGKLIKNEMGEDEGSQLDEGNAAERDANIAFAKIGRKYKNPDDFFNKIT